MRYLGVLAGHSSLRAEVVPKKAVAQPESPKQLPLFDEADEPTTSAKGGSKKTAEPSRHPELAAPTGVRGRHLEVREVRRPAADRRDRQEAQRHQPRARRPRLRESAASRRVIGPRAWAAAARVRVRPPRVILVG